LQLIGSAIINAVRCVPPQNKPAPSEINNCRRFLISTIPMMAELQAIVALGRIAHDSIVRVFGMRPAAVPFQHGAQHILPVAPHLQIASVLVSLYDSYHCSRYNTNTGVLTPEMFRGIFARVRDHFQPPHIEDKEKTSPRSMRSSQ